MDAMFRQAAVAARAVAKRPAGKLTGRAQHPRWSSSTAAQRRSSLLPRAMWLLAAGGAGYYFGGGTSISISSSASAPTLSSSAPGIPSAEAEADIPVESPVAVLDLAAANDRIREQAQSFVFANGQTQGRVDVVRVASNSRVEDEWAVAVGRGLAGGEALYAGVYDGHA